MKRHIVTVSLLSTILGAGVLNSQAAPMPNSPEGHTNKPAGDVPHPHGMLPPWRLDLLREKAFLNLTQDQESKIAEILASEREKISPLLNKLDTIREQLRQAEQAPVLDEPALRSRAEELSKTEIELIVSHAKMNRRVMEVLTPEQRGLLQKMEPHGKFPPGPPPERESSPDTMHSR
jgi:Spy/CpxP family protein refolding chaperone